MEILRKICLSPVEVGKAQAAQDPGEQPQTPGRGRSRNLAPKGQKTRGRAARPTSPDWGVFGSCRSIFFYQERSSCRTGDRRKRYQRRCCTYCKYKYKSKQDKSCLLTPPPSPLTSQPADKGSYTWFYLSPSPYPPPSMCI